MSEHTPTPWTYQERSDAYTHIIRSGDRFIVQLAQDSKGRAEADARLIVKAVNSHDVLVKALEECASRCRYDGDLFHDQGNALRMRASWDAADLAEAALASIKETAK